MNTETKTRISETVTEIKKQILLLTQENEVLRNCWEHEQGENEELKARIRKLFEENAALRCKTEDLDAQVCLLVRGFFAVGSDEILVKQRRTLKNRIHNLESGKIFKKRTLSDLP